MPNYVRPKVPGATIFFTVNLADRGSSALIRNIGNVRQAVQITQSERPFRIDAWVVLPDHMHCVWALPKGDADYAAKWRLIKSRYSQSLPNGQRRESHIRKAERGVWQHRFWEHHIRNADDSRTHIEYC